MPCCIRVCVVIVLCWDSEVCGSVRVNMLILVALQRNTLSCSRSARSRVISSRRRTTLVVRLASPRKRDCSSGPLMMNRVYVTWVD